MPENATDRSLAFSVPAIPVIPPTVSQGGDISGFLDPIAPVDIGKFPVISIFPDLTRAGDQVLLRTNSSAGFPPRFDGVLCRFSCLALDEDPCDPVGQVAPDSPGRFKDASIECEVPSGLTGSIRVAVSMDSGSTWSSVQSTGNFLTVYHMPVFHYIDSALSIRGGTVNVFGEGLPSARPIDCRWNGTEITAGEILSTQRLSCKIPSSFRRPSDALQLEVRLGNSWLKVEVARIEPEHPSGIIVPFSSGNLPILSLAQLSRATPLTGFAGTRTNINVCGRGFTSDFQVFCRFRDRATYLQSEEELRVPDEPVISEAMVSNDTHLTCPSPSCDPVGCPRCPGCVAVDLVIDVSIDAGNFYSPNLIGFYLFNQFLTHEILPAMTVAGSSGEVLLLGSGYRFSDDLKCRFTSATDSLTSQGIFIYSSLISCVLPPNIPIGEFAISVSVSGQDFEGTNLNLTVLPSPTVDAIIPTTGFASGGSLIEITGNFFTPGTICRFGDAEVEAIFHNGTNVACRAPTCARALLLEGDCAGSADVALSTNGFDFVAGGSFEYFRRADISGFSPFPGSPWDRTGSVDINVSGISDGQILYCRWRTDLTGPLPPSPAINVSNSQITCQYPSLPSAPSSPYPVVGSVELSVNSIDFSENSAQWLFYSPGKVLGASPLEFFVESPAFHLVSGTGFDSVTAVTCRWSNATDSFETEATVLSSTALICLGGESKLQIAVTPGGLSEGEVELLEGQKVSISNVLSTLNESSTPATIPPFCDGLFNVPAPLNGGVVLAMNTTASGDFWVTVGDFPVFGFYPNATYFPGVMMVSIPPADSPGFKAIAITRNFLQEQIVGCVHYQEKQAGKFWPLGNDVSFGLLEYPGGPGLGCPTGFSCSAGDQPVKCTPGTFSQGNATDCTVCPEGSACPVSGLAAPSDCTGICWGSEGFDAAQGICPIGRICVRPGEFGLAQEVGSALTEEGLPPSSLDDLTASGGSSAPSRRLTPVDSLPCFTGLFCPPGSIATENPDGSITADANVPDCRYPGVLCSEGSGVPYPVNIPPPEGSYVSLDGSEFLPCPPGASCSDGFAVSCPPGTYQDGSQTSCVACTAGTVCPVYSGTLPIPCPPGRVCSLPGRLSPTYLCPAGSTCLGGLLSLSTTGALASAYTPRICPVGTYCLAGTDSDIIDDLDPSAPRKCVEGFYCHANETSYRGQGDCPVGYYCVRSAMDPVVAPRGYFVASRGAYTPSRCEPGTYQPLEGQSSCIPCPDGFECTTDGTYLPISCPAGSFRSSSDSSYSSAQNVFCHPCPQGTWNYKGMLTAEGECLDCAARYVCGREGLTSFATKDQTTCAPNADGVTICYSTSQGTDCPEGYACDIATTSYTQYDYPCEAGYFCKSLTALPEIRNLLCPAGYYCRAATGASKARAFTCPANSFCPQGTAGTDAQDGSIDLFNVQADSDFVGTTDPLTGAQCRICLESVFTPPTSVDITGCPPCGELSSDGSIYVPVTAWTSLHCPEGTASATKSSIPDDCKQQGIVIAIVNIYNRSETLVLRDGTQYRLWGDQELQWLTPGSAGYVAKKSYPYGQPLSTGSDQLVDFLGFDPRKDRDTSIFHYRSVSLQALDILIVRLGFSTVLSLTRMITSGNPSGHYRLVISSDGLTFPKTAYDLPYILDQSDGVVNFDFSMKFTSLQDNLKVNISLELFHGSHLIDMHEYNNAINLEIRSPSRASVGTNKAFFALIDRDMLDGYELPYNMIPGLANQPGDPSMVADISGNKSLLPNTGLVTSMIPGATFWQVSGKQTVTMPWLPFMSDCEYFDRHINIWDITESADNVPAENGFCMIYEPNETAIVQPLVFDFNSMTSHFSAVSDGCFLEFTCQYEDKMGYSGGESIPWQSVPIETGDFFYLTRDPTAFADAGNLLGGLDSLAGTDYLVKVGLQAPQRTGKFPRRVQLDIEYVQKSITEKKITSATFTLSQFDDDTSNRSYTFNVNYLSMNWLVMMNNFQLPLSVYCIVYSLVGIGVMGLGWSVWVGFRLFAKIASMPKMRLLESYRFHFGWAFSGMLVATLPIMLLAGFVKVFFSSILDPLGSIPCAWTKGSSSGESVILGGTSDQITCKNVRT